MINVDLNEKPENLQKGLVTVPLISDYTDVISIYKQMNVM